MKEFALQHWWAMEMYIAVHENLLLHATLLMALRKRCPQETHLLRKDKLCVWKWATELHSITGGKRISQDLSFGGTKMSLCFFLQLVLNN